MPKILSPEEKRARWDAEDAARAERLAKKNNPPAKVKSAAKPVAKKEAPKKPINTKVESKDTAEVIKQVRKELSDEFKEATEELKKILQENKINGNGTNGHSANGHTNGSTKKTDTVIDAGKTEFYERLAQTEKHKPIQEPHIREAEILEEENNNPPPPGDNTGNSFNAEPLTEREKKEQEKREKAAEEPEEINWTESDIDNMINLIPLFEEIAINGAFAAIDFFCGIFDLPRLNRIIDAKDIPPLDEFRRSLLRPGIETLANKIVGDWRNPDSILPIMALFGILDAFIYSKPTEASAE